MRWLVLAALIGCGGNESYIVDGQVLKVADGQLTIDHERIPRYAEDGIDVYPIRDPAVMEGIEAGHTVTLRLEIDDQGPFVAKARKTGHRALPDAFRKDRVRLVGKVVRVDDDRVVIDHQAIPGVMGAMVMPFEVKDPAIIEGLSEGDEVEGTLLTEGGFLLIEVHKVKEGTIAFRTDIVPLRVGQFMPALEIPVEDGTTVTVGQGAGIPVVLTFIYTRCPDPEFCPAVVARLQALQQQFAAGEALIVTVTLDPDYDTAEVMTTYGQTFGADPERWHFGRLEKDALQELALRAGLTVTKEEGGKIGHFLRMLVMNEGGRVLERYDDNAWPQDRVVQQLKTGEPMGRPGASGSVYKKVEGQDEDAH